MTAMTLPLGNSQMSKSSNSARSILKSEMVRRGITFDMLSEMIKIYGHEITGKNLNAKINRGAFSASFFLEVLEVLGVKAIDLR